MRPFRMKLSLPVVVSAAASVLLPTPAQAQTQGARSAPGETELDRVLGEATVRAPTRDTERLIDTPRSVVRDTRQDAARALARDVGDRLDELPGVFVQRTTSMSAAPLIRGLGGQRSLLLFDGLRLNDSLTKVGGNALLTMVDAMSVRSVEVLRGPASVIYGSDALGGVVLVNPLDAVARADGSAYAHGEVSMRYASAERSVQGGALVEGEAGPWGALFSGTMGETGRLMAGGPLGVQPYSGFRDRTGSLRVTLTPSRGHRVGVALHGSAITDAPRSDLSSPMDTRVFRLQQRDLAYAHYRGDFGALVVSARAGVMRREEIRDRFREGRVDTERDEVLTAHVALQADLRVRQARVTAGLDLASDDVASATDTTRAGRPVEVGRGRYVGGSAYTQGGVYAYYRQRLGASDRWLFEAGGRLAFVSARAPVDGMNPSLDHAYLAPVASVGGRVLVAPGVSLMASVLGGFRAPNLDDYQSLGSGARSFDVPNNALGPERSWTAEAGVRVIRPRWSMTAFVYGSRLTGMVVRVPSTFNGMTMIDGRRVYTRANASEGTLWGAELDAGYRPPTGFQAALGASYTWAEATLPLEDGTNVTEPLAKVPPAFGRASTGWRWARGWVEAVLTGALAQTRLATSDRDDVRLCPSGPTGCAEVAGYASVALRGGAQLHARFTLAAAIENVFDTAYTPYGWGLPAPGVNVVVALRGNTD